VEFSGFENSRNFAAHDDSPEGRHEDALMLLPRQLKSERGSTLVEFGQVAFLLITTMLAMVEFGRMLVVYTTVANSARAGARYAIVHGSDRGGSGVTGPSGPTACTDTPPAQVVSVIKNFASAGMLDTSKLTIKVCYSPLSNLPGTTVIVKVGYPYDPLTGWFNMLSVNLSSQTAGVITF
jgi:Flp pilus assembly protein TadG